MQDDVITSDDVAAMNEQSVSRSAAILRLTGAVLIAVGLVGAVAWLWFEIRIQQQLSSGVLDFNVNTASGRGLDLVDRVDALANSIQLLMFGMLPIGIGVMSRLVADYAVTHSGGSVTGFVAGDVIHDVEEDV